MLTVIEENRLRNKKKVYAFTNMVVAIIIIIKCKYIYIHTGKRLTYRVFSYQLGGFFVSWWGSFKVGRPCQGVNYDNNYELHQVIGRF